MIGPLRVLLLEDSVADAELTLRALSGAGLPIETLRVDSPADYLHALKTFAPHLILSDFSLPTFDGLSALELTRTTCPDVPFVFVSGTIGEERAVEAMRRGATDYVLKDRLERLIPVVTRAIKEAEERTARRKAEQQLADTKERLDSILASLVDIVWSRSVQPDRLLYLNPAVESICQRPASAFYRHPRLWFAIIHSDDRDPAAKHWERARHGDIFDVEYRIVRKDGEIRWIHNRARPVRDDAGNILRFDGLARDITERKIQEQKIARLSRIREVLGGINSVMLRAQDKSALFREACRIAVEAGQFRMAWIGIPTPDQTCLTPMAWMGEEQVREVSGSLAMLPADSGMARRTLLEKRAFVSNDIAADVDLPFKAEALQRGYRSLIVLPLVSGNEAIALFTLYAAEPNFFDQQEIALLSELAGDISFALDSMAKEEKLNYLAYYDVLTGLCNRHFLAVRLAQELAYDQRHELGLTVLSVDIDNFKVINDSLGHNIGDLLLKAVAERLLECTSSDDIVARYAGDEFALVLTDQGHAPDGSHLIQRILTTVAQPIQVDAREFHLTCSVGASVFPQDGANAETLLRNADAAMHRAKELGRNRFQFYAQEMNSVVTERLVLDAALRRALQRSEFSLHFQPKVSLLDGQVTGFEALLRWNHADIGPVPPTKFIPILEQNGLIVDVGDWVLAAACAQIETWRSQGVQPIPIAVNLSARQLHHNDLDRRIKRILSESGADPGMIEIEITESVLMQNAEQVIGILRNLQQMGIRLSVDDFGTGYSSLAYLRSFPLDSLKIDRSFISDVTTNPDAALIVRAVISMAQNLRLKVVAEGVETSAQLAFLAASGCDEMQGYFFARPADADACTRLLRERRKLDMTAFSATSDAPALLLVDDEESVRAALKRLLRRDGHRILTAANAEEGFALLASNAVGVVVADQRMPGMTGVEFLSRVKDLYPHTVRVVLSGYTDLKSVTDAINRGAVYRFFSKPWNDDELRSEIKQAFARAAQMRANDADRPAQ